MPFYVAASWSFAALFLLDLLAGVLMASRTSVDLVSRVLCQGAAFVAILAAITVVHEKGKALREIFALRRVDVLPCLLALALGVLLQGPLSLLANVIYSRFPPPEQDVAEIAQLFEVPALYQKVGLVVAAGALGPLVEELFFRGALFGALARRYGRAGALAAASLLFAAAHRDLRSFAPDLVGGAVMGLVRVWSGSLWPALLVHAAFNTSSALYGVVRGPEGDLFTRSQSVAVSVALVAVLLVYRATARRSARAASARDQDGP
jgi:membrane protease YdiL (CAAX protease family)